MSLPTEIIDYILSQSPNSELQSTTLSLLKAGVTGISRSGLVRHIHITREGQSWQASKYLRIEQNKGLAGSVHTARVEVWRDDPQMLTNLVATFPNLRSLNLTVGPIFSPEQLEEMLEKPKWKTKVKRIWFRFNPYVNERSYYTFLKGTYFDSTPRMFASWVAGSAPNLRRLAFVQDLPPNHGKVMKVTPAFGLTEISDALDDLSLSPAVSEIIPIPEGSTADEAKMDFAQPIVFFNITCLTQLAHSSLGSQLTHLVLRLPRRNLLPSLTTPFSNPFPHLLHLDLSTTHIPSSDNSFPLFLTHFSPTLEHLVLDRCTGLILPKEVTEPSAFLTLKWLGRNCVTYVGSRSDENARAWRRIVKDRPTGVIGEGPPPMETELEPNGKGRTGAKKGGKLSAVAARREAEREKKEGSTKKRIPFVLETDTARLVSQVLFVPALPRLKSLGLGLYDLDRSVTKSWKMQFELGYQDGINRLVEKVDDAIHRYEMWEQTGKLEDGTRRMVTQRDAVPHELSRFWDEVDRNDKADEEEPDEIFQNFCKARGLISISPRRTRLLLSALKTLAGSFVFCSVPDCSHKPGTPHLSLSLQESVEQRERREKESWEREKREEKEWRREDKDHQAGCSHLESRSAWDEERE